MTNHYMIDDQNMQMLIQNHTCYDGETFDVVLLSHFLCCWISKKLTAFFCFLVVTLRQNNTLCRNFAQNDCFSNNTCVFSLTFRNILELRFCEMVVWFEMILHYQWFQCDVIFSNKVQTNVNGMHFSWILRDCHCL